MTFEDLLIQFSIPKMDSKAIAKHLFGIAGSDDPDLTDEQSQEVLDFADHARSQGVSVKKAIAEASKEPQEPSGQRPQNFGVHGRFDQQAQDLNSLRAKTQQQETQQARLGAMLRLIEGEAIEVAVMADLQAWDAGIGAPQTEAEGQLLEVYRQVRSAKDVLKGGGQSPLDRYGWGLSPTGDITLNLDTIALPMQTLNALPAAQ